MQSSDPRSVSPEFMMVPYKSFISSYAPRGFRDLEKADLAQLPLDSFTKTYVGRALEISGRDIQVKVKGGRRNPHTGLFSLPPSIAVLLYRRNEVLEFKPEVKQPARCFRLVSDWDTAIAQAKNICQALDVPVPAATLREKIRAAEQSCGLNTEFLLLVSITGSIEILAEHTISTARERSFSHTPFDPKYV